ncbi:NAD(P)/FAD-dependent oxidoreductase [Mycobacterium sp. Y57]|uniref:flavin-containing monooxygenase n=1 Tax=Mycolicibacterium xanthum TaxID=2796469 RepID=UPI001C846D7B|nr:NAD(P)-binding domain-containing protein [Mycolicibacterium xanthum]MBX7431394.1 NAD(P)/FAD-dependent oxidoreductase [Mycolicibacterium xanthum]
MTTQHIETLIIGAGQAGLSTAYHLRRMDRPMLIVDRNARIGDNWRGHYDSLRLYTPAKYSGLPGLPFPADPWYFPGKDDVADYLEEYARTFDLPVRTNTAVDRLSTDAAGRFVASLGADTLTCDNVVVATGTFGRSPNVPEFADQLAPGIRQLHSSQYRGPHQLDDGPVLVVGASHSGTDIAYELAADRTTMLVGRDCGQIPVRWDSPALHLVLPVLRFVWRHVLTRRTPMGRKEMAAVRAHGGPMIRVKRSDLADRGVRRLTTRIAGVRNGLPVAADGSVLDVRNVIWCTGFRQKFDWIDLPVLDQDGWPEEYRGVVRNQPGLYFCGLSFQFSFGSMLFFGVGRDAEYVARRVAERSGIRQVA